MLSYRNDPTFKEKFVALLQLHQEQDRIVQGAYGTTFSGKWQGCAVGCSVRSLHLMSKDGEHSEYLDELLERPHANMSLRLGIPMVLAFLEDSLFERMSMEAAATWPVKFGTAIPVGKDLTPVFWRFIHAIATTTGRAEGQQGIRDYRAVLHVAQVADAVLSGAPLPEVSDFISGRYHYDAVENLFLGKVPVSAGGTGDILRFLFNADWDADWTLWHEDAAKKLLEIMKEA